MNPPVEYQYSQGGETGLDSDIWSKILAALSQVGNGARVLDLGSGNGYRANLLRTMGYEVVGVEPSASEIAVARSNYPETQFVLGSTEQPLAEQLGQFDAVISIEVIEHVFSVAGYVAELKRLLKPAGIAVLTTPYHGWLKNVLIALLGKFDAHVDPLWEGGHIKFFSCATLQKAMENGGFRVRSMQRAGRIPMLAKSIVLVATHQSAA